jgi:hypothetical protein
MCRLEREQIQRYLDGFMYEDVTNVDLRAKMRAAQGWCQEHTAQAILVRDSLGLAIIYQDILQSVDKEMRQHETGRSLPSPSLLGRERTTAGQRLARRLSPQRTCPACAVRDEISGVGLQTLVANVLDARSRPVYVSSSGLCLPHFRRALALTNDRSVIEVLAARQSQVMNDLVAELAEFIRKHDYRFRHEEMAGESDSWQRAIELVAGESAVEVHKKRG